MPRDLEIYPSLLMLKRVEIRAVSFRSMARLDRVCFVASAMNKYAVEKSSAGIIDL